MASRNGLLLFSRTYDIMKYEIYTKEVLIMNIPMASVLRRYRRERNITQETLADALGVTFQSVSRRENGLAYPDVELIPKIAGYFGISADVLFGTDKDTLESAHS